MRREQGDPAEIGLFSWHPLFSTTTDAEGPSPAPGRRPLVSLAAYGVGMPPLTFSVSPMT